jgi:hypothetical protein
MHRKAKQMNGFWVVMKNSLGCELIREWAPTAGNASVILGKLANDMYGELSDGDTFTIEEGWSETI